jgi:outer membrane protein assembly factor BamD (BamD/ComL family)
MKNGLIILVGLIVLFGTIGDVHAEVNLNEIEAAIIGEDYSRAKSLCEELMANYPEAAQVNDAKYYLGLSELRLNNFDQAKAIFESLVKELPQGPLSDKANLGLIDVANLSEHYEQALEQAKAFLAAQPQTSSLSLVYLKMARSNLKLARWDEARKLLNKILQEFPQSMEFHTAIQLLEEKQYYTVQVGAFLDRERADRLSRELQDKDEYSYIVETVDAQGNKFFRVRVGKFSQLSEAKDLKQKMSGQGFPTLIYP